MTESSWAKHGEAWLIVLLFVATLPFVTTRIYASDEIEYFAYLRSVWFDGDLSFENEYRYFYESGAARNPGFHETFLERHTETGLRLNFAPVGCAILWAPFYAAADLFVRMTGQARWPANGFSSPYIAAVAYGSAAYGLGAVLLSWHAARQLTLKSAGLAAVVVWLGSPLIFYTHVAPPMSHASSAFIVALFIVVWLRVRRTWSPGGCALLGALAAVMAMVREQDIFFAAAPVFDFVRTVVPSAGAGPHGRQGLKAPALRVTAAAVAFAVAYIPQAVAYLTLNGRLGPSQVVSRKMSWTSPHGLSVLGSPAHGFLFWTPLAVLAIAGLVILIGWSDRVTRMRHARWIAVLALVVFTLQVYIAGSVESWTVAGAFGQRRFVSLTAVLCIGIAALLTAAATRPRRVAAVAAIALCVWWNVGLMAQFGSGMMDRQRLEPVRNAYVSFMVLPAELPRLVLRYLVDRESFYQPPDR